MIDLASEGLMQGFVHEAVNSRLNSQQHIMLPWAKKNLKSLQQVFCKIQKNFHIETVSSEMSSRLWHFLSQ